MGGAELNSRREKSLENYKIIPRETLLNDKDHHYGVTLNFRYSVTLFVLSTNNFVWRIG